jgi:elongation factor P
MYSLTDLKTGVAIELEGAPFVILSHEHSKMGRGGAVMRTRIRNLESGAVMERTFKPSEKVKPAGLERKAVQYLYAEGEQFNFMDSSTFDQFALSRSDLGEAMNFVKEGETYELMFFRGRPISVDLPAKVVLEVTHTEPGEKGNSANASTKPATLETGYTLQVPLFVKNGDKIRVDTRNGNYLERV